MRRAALGINHEESLPVPNGQLAAVRGPGIREHPPEIARLPARQLAHEQMWLFRRSAVNEPASIRRERPVDSFSDQARVRSVSLGEPCRPFAAGKPRKENP